MADSTSVIRAEFDRLAGLSCDERWNQNSHYHNFLLKHLPTGCRHALEIGCGTGAFSRRLAERSERVLAIDLSPEMIRLARERSREFPNIDFHVADVVEQEFPSEEFDAVATIAAMHHLPMKLMLAKMKRALKPGGVILILDLVEPENLYDTLANALALPVNVGMRLFKQHRLRAPAEVRRAWAEHEQYDSYPTLSEVRAACAEPLPGAVVRRHLLWRYSVVWKKVVI
jgi:ubiquinone/menaquinone biosynthesis C-methylase UbiE